MTESLSNLIRRTSGGPSAPDLWPATWIDARMLWLFVQSVRPLRLTAVPDGPGTRAWVRVAMMLTKLVDMDAGSPAFKTPCWPTIPCGVGIDRWLFHLSPKTGRFDRHSLADKIRRTTRRRAPLRACGVISAPWQRASDQLRQHHSHSV